MALSAKHGNSLVGKDARMTKPLEVGLLIQPVNPWDWERYEAGAFDRSPPVSDAEVWDNIRQVALLAEPLGFDAFWITEHHRTPYGMSPNPLQVLAWLAGRTERIDLGAAVVVLPWHDPVRVAEDIAQLHNLAAGRRLRNGFGRGAAASEYEHLRIDQATARERFDEGIEIVRAALSRESFGYDGDIFRVPQTSIRPRPRGQRLVEDMFCAFVGESSLRAAAKMGLEMCFNVAKAYDLVRADTDLFNAIRAENGFAPIQPMIVQLMYCAETDEEARVRASEHMAAYYGDANRHYRIHEIGGVRGYEHYQAGGVAAEASAPDVLANSIWGTPERCLAQIRELREQTGLKHLLLASWYGKMPVAEAERSLRLFAREVLPKVRQLSPAPALAG
jgi:alkanesulfonate monooxygenase SsuD/methylene tetrahydromethanopterin reductase-like flavin-dependent oxidoreductase (luciferase family)